MSQNKLLIFYSFLALCASILVCLPIYNVMLYYFHSLAITKNCPLCFGQDMCSCLSDNLTFNWNYFWTNVINFCFGKQVIFGFCDGNLVVIKKFAIPKEYVNVTGNSDLHNIAAVVQLMKKSYEDHSETQQKFEICPSLDKVEHLCGQFKGNYNGSNNNLEESPLYKNLLHIVQVNISPIVQQIGSAYEWAVSEYLGSCGDAVFSQYCGEALTNVFPRLSWAERSSISKQLLQFAFNVTFRHPDFAFYFTDMTPDNFAVSSDNVVRLVDLEHVIIVDKNPTDRPAGWDEHHKSYHDTTEQGFAFSPREVCSHKASDLNVYSICQGILSENADLLSGGLLHSPPLQKLRVSKLIQDCISPAAGQSRFDLAQAIVEELDTIQMSVEALTS